MEEKKSTAHAKDIFVMATTESRICCHPLAAIRLEELRKKSSEGKEPDAFGVYRHNKHETLHVFAGYAEHPAFTRVCDCPTLEEILAMKDFDAVILTQGEYGNGVQLGSVQKVGRHSFATLLACFVTGDDPNDYKYSKVDMDRNPLF